MNKIISLLMLIMLFPQVGNTQTDTIKASADSRILWVTDKPVPKFIIQSTRDFRERLLGDHYRPAFHFCEPEGAGSPGDPNGAFYYNGQYHLMYLYNREGRGFSWGHISSSDLLHWRHHPDAIGPGNGDEGCFSGGAFVDKNGKAVLSYWQLWGARGIGLAENNDKSFDKWTKSSSNPVIKSTDWGITVAKDKNNRDVIYGSADPSNIWFKDGQYYMLTGNLLVLRKYGSHGTGLPANDPHGPGLPADSVSFQGDHLYLFASKDLKQWEYLHEFYKSDRRWTDKTEDNMCPSFLPLPSGPDGGTMSDKYLLLFISHNKGCQYYIGSYRNDMFYPDNHGRMTWNDNAYFAPEALVDGKGRQIMWSWVFDDRPDSIKNYYGWTGSFGLPRSLWLGEDGTLRMRPVKELENLRQNEKVKRNFTVKAGSDSGLDDFGSELLELEITMLPGNSKKCGVMVCCSKDGREKTILYYDALKKKLMCDATGSSIGFGRKIVEGGPFELKPDEPLVLHVFVDRSIVEVFANDRQAVTRNIYPELRGTGVKLFSEGGDVKVLSVKAWEMTPANPY